MKQKYCPKVAVGICSSKLKILQYSQEDTCVWVSFNKVADLEGWNFIQKELQQRCGSFWFQRENLLKNTLKTSCEIKFTKWNFLACHWFATIDSWDFLKRCYLRHLIFELFKILSVGDSSSVNRNNIYLFATFFP